MNAVTPIVLDGEITAGVVTVFFYHHPLQHKRMIYDFAPGLNIQEIIDLCIEKHHAIPIKKGHVNRPLRSDYYRVLLGEGNLIEPENWTKVKPKAGAYLVLRPVAKGPVVALVAGISAAFTAFSAAITGLGFFGQLLWAGISFGLKFLLNKLFAPKQPKQQALDDPKPAYSIQGSRNDANPYGAIPVILGKHRVVPPYGAQPYTEIVGDDQYLRMIFVIGYGALAVTKLQIGETPIDDFEDVTYQIRSGFSSDALTTLYPEAVFEEQLSVLLEKTNGWEEKDTATDIHAFTVDLFWKDGAIRLYSSGNRKPLDIQVLCRYRLKGSGTWINGPTVKGTYKTTDPFRKTIHVGGLAKGQYEVQVYNSMAKLGDPAYKSQILEDVVWTALKGFRNGEPIPYDQPLSVVAIRIRASDQLNGVVDTFNCVASSRITAYNTSSHVWEDYVESAWPPDLFRHVLTWRPNARPVSVSRIDLVSLQNWKVYCVSQGFRFNMPINATTSVLDVLLDICACGRATPVFKDGKWSVVWDEQSLPVVQMFTPRNSWGFECVQEFFDPPHALRCKFVDEDKQWIDNERIVYDDGYNKTNATRYEGFECPGCTDYTQIWKMGRFQLAQIQLRPARYSLMCDWEGITLLRNDRVQIAHDSILTLLASGRVTAVSGSGPNNSITVDETIDFDPGRSYTMIFRTSTLSFISRTVLAGTSGELKTFFLTGDTTIPNVGALWTIGDTGQQTSIYRVLAVEPSDDMTFRLTFVDDAPAISLADTGSIPNFDSNITAPPNPYNNKPSGSTLSAVAYQSGTNFYARLTIRWALYRNGKVREVQVQYRNETDKVWRTVGSFPVNQVETFVSKLGADSYTSRVRAHFRDGTYSAWTQSATLNAKAIFAPPKDVERFRIAVHGGTSVLTWAAPSGGAVFYEIRKVPGIVASPVWNTATPIVKNNTTLSFTTPTTLSTYLIKSKYPSGIYAVNPAITNSGMTSIDSINLVETLVEVEPFTGVLDDCEVIDGEIRLRGNNVMATWTTLGDVVTIAEGTGIDDSSAGNAVEGYYYIKATQDLGDVYTALVSPVIDAYGFAYNALMSSWASLGAVDTLDSSQADGWDVTVEYRTTIYNPTADVWSEWIPLDGGSLEYRAIQFRLYLEGDPSDTSTFVFSSTTPSITGISIKIDMVDRDIYGSDLAVPIGGLTVTFPTPFRGPVLPATPPLAISRQDCDTGDYEKITLKSVNGFKIQFFNAAGVAIAGRTFDYHAKGWGKKVT